MRVQLSQKVTDLGISKQQYSNIFRQTKTTKW